MFRKDKSDHVHDVRKPRGVKIAYHDRGRKELAFEVEGVCNECSCIVVLRKSFYHSEYLTFLAINKAFNKEGKKNAT